MYITESTIQQLKGLRLSSVVGRIGNVTLKKGKCKCPLPNHKENTASFSVHDGKGIYKCFGCHEKGNNPIAFTMTMLNQTFVEACKSLAKEFNIKIEYEEVTQELKQRLEAVMECKEVLRFATEKYKKLAHNEYKALFKEILIQKNISEETALIFDLGFAPDAADTLKKTLISKGSVKPAIETGILKEGDKGNIYDFYRGRLMVPIVSHISKETLSFSGRNVLQQKDLKKIPKWLNGPESIVFPKREILYGYPQAASAINKEDSVILVEGYTDVYAMRQNGAENTVATMGTAFTKEQMNFILNKTENIQICADGDKAGRIFMKTSVKKLLKRNIIPTVWLLKDGEDPHSYFYPKSNLNGFKPFQLGATRTNSIENIQKENGLKWLVAQLLKEKKDPVIIAKEKKQVLNLLASIRDPELREVCSGFIAEEFKIKVKRVETIVRQNAKEEAQKEKRDNAKDINLTKDQKTDIRRFGFYEKDNQYWFTSSEEFYGMSKANFIIIPDMLIKGQKRIMQLINRYGHKEQIEFDIKDMTNLGSFNTKIEGYGNFLFEGQDTHLKKIKRKIYEKEKYCILPGFLGWDPKNRIQVMANGVLTLEGDFIPVNDKNIVPVKDKIYYYLPYLASEEHKLKWKEQAKFKFIENGNNFAKYASLFYKVHGDCAMVVLMDACVSFFADHIFKEMGNKMPMLFVNGQTQTGKTTMVSGVLSLWGQKQSLIDLSNRSTTKGMTARLSQFNNMPILLDEYKNLDAKKYHGGMLRGLYNRNSYLRKNFSQDNSTNSPAIRGKAIVVGTDKPTAFEDLYTRFFIIKYSLRETPPELLDKLMDMEDEGCSESLRDLIKCRAEIEANFKTKYRELKTSYQEEMKEQILSSRNVEALSMILSVYDILSAKIDFPFTRDALEKFLKDSLITQRKDFGQSLITENFWDIFQEAVKNHKVRIGYDYKIQTDVIDDRVRTVLKFRFKSIFMAYTRVYGDVYKTQSPMGKSTLRDHLISDKSFMEIAKGVRFHSSPTTAMVFDYNDLKERGFQLYPQTELTEKEEGNNDKTIIEKMKKDMLKMAANPNFIPEYLIEEDEKEPEPTEQTKIEF